MKPCLLVLFFVLSTPLIVLAQNSKQIKFSVSVAADWTNLFCKSSGWFGGDGIYTIPMNGVESSKSKSKRTLVIFSDTMIGEIKEGILQPDSKMIHNAVAILDGNYPDPENLNFYWKKEGLQPQSVFIPKTPNTGAGDYYWLGDGFVNQEINNSIFIFGYRVKTISNAAFGFEEVGNTLLKIKSGEPIPFKNYKQKDTPFFLDRTESEKGSFGAGIFVNTTMAGASNRVD